MRKVILSLASLVTVTALSYAVYYYRTVYSNPPATKAADTETAALFKEVTATEAAVNIQKTDELRITIAAPRAEITLTQEPTIKLAAATKRNAVVVITGGKVPIIRAVDNDGSFAPDIELNEGINKLTITAFDQNGGKKATEKTIVYLKDALSDTLQFMTGTLSTQNDTLVLNNNDQKTPILTTKQTKLYQTNNGAKKTIKNTSLFDAEQPVMIGVEKEATTTEKSATVILQEISEIISPKIVYAKVENKNISEENFIFEVRPFGSEKTEELTVTSDTNIAKTNEPNTKSRGADIKIGDKILYIQSQEDDSYTTTHVLIVPGQASGILKDVRQATSSPEKEE